MCECVVFVSENKKKNKKTLGMGDTFYSLAAWKNRCVCIQIAVDIWVLTNELYSKWTYLHK